MRTRILYIITIAIACFLAPVASRAAPTIFSRDSWVRSRAREPHYNTRYALVADDLPIEPKMYHRLCQTTTTCPYTRQWVIGTLGRMGLFEIVEPFLASISK